MATKNKTKKASKPAMSKTKKPAMSKTEIAAEVQAITGYSISHITKVMCGYRKNADISKALKVVTKNNK